MTPQKETELRIEADKLAEKLYETIQLNRTLEANAAERVAVQDFFERQVVQSLSQRATRTEVDNQLYLRELSTR